MAHSTSLRNAQPVVDTTLLDRIEERGLVWLGVLEMALGTVFSLLVIPLHSLEGASTFFSHLGVGLLGAGVLTSTVEALAHRRNERYVKHVHEATALTVLRQLIPDAVFAEVQNQIVAKPFTRSEFRWEIEFTWEDDAHTRLRRRATVRYRVKNATLVPQVLGFGAVEDWPLDDQPSFVDITHVYIRREGESAGRAPNVATLPEKKQMEPGQLVVAEDVPLKPDETVSIVWKSVREEHPNDKSPLIFTHATRGFTLSVHHPPDLAISLQIQHPDEKAFQVDADDVDHHSWHFDGGFLPFQGVTLGWKKVVPPADRIPALVLIGKIPPEGREHWA